MFLSLRALCALLLVIASSTSVALPPEKINYQGYLTDDNNLPLNGTTDLLIALYSSPTSTRVAWSQADKLSVLNGRFSTLLDASGSNPFPKGLFDGTVYVGISVNGDTEMTPRLELTSVPFALESGNADSANSATLASNSLALEGYSADALITAASDEVRTPINSLPFTINASGSYYLTGNLDGTNGGINITAADVTLDLGGFTIDGNGAADSGIYGENIPSITVINGTIKDFAHYGLYLSEDDDGGYGHRIENLKVFDNQLSGIHIEGDEAQVHNCLAKGNGGVGIRVGADSMVQDSIASGNGDVGIYSGYSTTIINNIVSYNSGANGIYGNQRAKIIGNLVTYNSDVGIRGRSESHIEGNSVARNAGWGIVGEGRNKVTGNTITANNSSLETTKGGLSISADSQVTDNHLDGNSAYGIRSIGSGNLVKNNNVSGTSAISGVGFCYEFNSSSTAVIGNTASSCTTAFGGGAWATISVNRDNDSY